MKSLLFLILLLLGAHQQLIAQVKDADGNVYGTVIIGDQEWFEKNLNSSAYANGVPIPEVRDNFVWKEDGSNKLPAWSHYENDSANANLFGKLYNWYAVVNANNICPDGWHVPSRKDWKELSDFLESKKEGGLKLKRVEGWENDNGGKNTTGFSALPGGWRSEFGKFNSLGQQGIWWSSSAANIYTASYRMLSGSSSLFYKSSNYYEYGYSVRCLKN